MNPLRFLFELVDKVSPLEPAEKLDIETDGNNWYKTIETKKFGAENPEDRPKSVPEKIKAVGENWGTRLALNIVFPFAHKFVAGFDPALWLMGKADGKAEEISEEEQDMQDVMLMMQLIKLRNKKG